MDTRNYLINEIKLKMQDIIDIEQMKKLDIVLMSKLNDYDFTARETSVALSEDFGIEILKQFVLTKRLEGCSPKTLKRYWYVNSDLLRYINKNISDITTADLKMYVEYYRCRISGHVVSNRSLDGMRRCFSSFFSWVFANGYIKSNPCLTFKKIAYDKRIPDPYTNIELELIRRACSSLRNRAIVETLYSTGCRVSEIAALNIRDIDFVDKSVVVFGKGSKERLVFLNDIAVYYLKKYINSRTDTNECLFASSKRPYERIKVGTIEALVRNLGKSVDIDKSHPHKFRHTFATNMIERGAQIQDVQTLLGHEDISTTQLYITMNKNRVRDTYNKCMQ